MNLGGVDLIVALCAFLVVAAGVIGLNFRISRNTQNVANYRDAAQSWESKAKAQEIEIADLNAKVANLTQKLAAETEARHTLEGIVTGKTAVETLRLEMQNEFTSLKAAFTDWTSEARREHATQRELFQSWTGEARTFMGDVSHKLDRET